MANTRSSTFGVRLKPETKKRLARLAQASGRSSNFLISDAVDSCVAGTPYVILYRVRRKRVTISTIWHGVLADQLQSV
jgi:predicted transcriptional regulator